MKIRWLSLGETVAVAAVVISGLGLYNSWNRAETPSPAATADGPKKPSSLTLRAEAQGDGARLALSPVSSAQVVQSQTIAFPTPLAIAPVETTGDPRIEAGWVDAALRKVADAEQQTGAGDRRVPVLITTRYIEDDAEKTDRAVYQLGYVLSEGGLFGGRHVRLRGLSLSARGVADGQKRIDAQWAGQHKAAPQ